MGKSILICDDAAFMRMMIKDILSKNGYTVAGEAENGLKAVEKYKYSNPQLYDNLVKRIKQESIFPRYVICMYYGDYYANIQEMRANFRDDWNELGFSVHREHEGDMQSIFTNNWGL